MSEGRAGTWITLVGKNVDNAGELDNDRKTDNGQQQEANNEQEQEVDNDL